MLQYCFTEIIRNHPDHRRLLGKCEARLDGARTHRFVPRAGVWHKKQARFLWEEGVDRQNHAHYSQSANYLFNEENLSDLVAPSAVSALRPRVPNAFVANEERMYRGDPDGCPPLVDRHEAITYQGLRNRYMRADGTINERAGERSFDDMECAVRRS